MNPQNTFPLPKQSHKALFAIIALAVLLVVSLAFGAWAYGGRQDYKNNTDKKIASAVSNAKTAQAAQLQQQFNEQSKNPNKTFKGPATYGSVSFNYPKTWSAYVDESDTNEPINAYFYPDQVPGINSQAAYALRVELVNIDYANVLQQFNANLTAGLSTAAAYVPPKMKNTANIQPGTRLDGAIGQGNSGGIINGSMVILKVRDKTLQVYTQSTDFLNDFNNTILPSLTFAP